MDHVMPTEFQLIAGNAALDLVNTLDNRFAKIGPTELLGGYGDLLRFVEQAGLLDAKSAAALKHRKESPAAARAFAQALALREALASLLYGKWTSTRPPSNRILKILERHFLAAEEHTELKWNPSSSAPSTALLDWQWGRHQTNPSLPVWILAQSAAQLLTSTSMIHVRMCRSETCRWLFLDTSKNHTRRWCDMKVCGNRMKARRFNQRSTAAGPSAST